MEELFDLASLAAAPLYGSSSSSSSSSRLKEDDNDDTDRTVLVHHPSQSVSGDKKDVRGSYEDIHKYVSGRSHELTKLMNQFDELMSELAPQQESGSPLLSRTSPSTSRGTKRNNKGIELTINEESLPALPSEGKDPPQCLFTSSSSRSLVHSIDEQINGTMSAIDISSSKKVVVACPNRIKVETEESSECKQDDSNSSIPPSNLHHHKLDVSGVIQQQIQAQESIDKQHQIRQLETTNRTLLLSLQEERSLRAISDEQRQRALEEITEVTVPNNTLLTHLVKQHSPSEYSCLLPPLYNTYTPQVQVQSEVNIEDHKLAVVRLKAQVRALCSEQVQATNPHPLGKPQLISTPSVPSQTYYNDLAYNL